MDLVRWKELLYLFLRTRDGADDTKQFNTQQRTTVCRQTAICNASQNQEDYLWNLDFWQKKSNSCGKKCLILNINNFFLILILLVIMKKGSQEVVCKVSLEPPSKILPRDSDLRQCGCTCTGNRNVPSFGGDRSSFGLWSWVRQQTGYITAGRELLHRTFIAASKTFVNILLFYSFCYYSNAFKIQKGTFVRF